MKSKIGNHQKDFFEGFSMPEFKNLRKRIRRRRIETALLAGYAFAVTCALFLSLLNKPSEPKLPIYHVQDEKYDFNNDVLTPAFNDSAADNPFEEVYAQVNSLKLLSDQDVVVQKFLLSQNGQTEVIMPIISKPKYDVGKDDVSGIYQKERRVLVVQKGDTFIGMLTKLGMDNKTATDAYNTLRKVFDARKLQVNQYMILVGTFDIQSHTLEALDTLTFEPTRGTKYILRVNEYDKFESLVEQEKFEKDVKIVEGVVDGQVANSLMKSGMPNFMANTIISRFAHLINYRTDIHKGDKFRAKYEVSKASNGEVVKVGGLLYASFITAKRTYSLYRYKDEFYTEKGEAKKTGLDIKPMQVRNARISSLYGYRMHPIHKTRKFHSGVDYAAPKGTEIYASGNGVVEMARYVNGYGNFVKIRHNSEYETAYGHMQRFASGIRPGVRVRKGQVIGYVGSTGRSTGPHLHFEIIRKGQRINPLKAKVATGNDLTGRQLTEFKQTVKRIDAMVEKVTEIKEVEKQPLGTTAQKLASNNVKKVLMIPSELPAEEKIAVNDSVSEDKSNKIHVESEKTQMISAEKSVETKITTVETENNDEAEETSEVFNETPAYKGKVIYPMAISAAQARKKYILQRSPLLAKIAKVVKIPPARKPKNSQRTAR